MTNTPDPVLLFDKDGAGVAWLTLNRPRVLNAMNMAMRDELWSAMLAVRDDPEIRVAVFRGAGDRAFSAGADISEFGTAPSYVNARHARHERDLWGLMLSTTKPLVAAIHGYAFGAGCELGLLCDIRIAADDALFSLPEVTLGYIPSAGGTQTLPRAIPPGIAREMVLTETPHDATPTGRWSMGCLLRSLIAIAGAVALVIAIGFAFDQGDNADQPQHGYDAGQADAYKPGTVNYLEAQHVFVTRLPDGGFVALYDLSTRQQELGGDCRLQFQDTAGVGTLDPLSGITGAIVEECNGIRAVWRADGKYAFGAGYGDLDRFNTSVDTAGHLIIDTDSRSCTRSRGVIGVAPFDKRRCEGSR